MSGLHLFTLLIGVLLTLAALGTLAIPDLHDPGLAPALFWAAAPLG